MPISSFVRTMLVVAAIKKMVNQFVLRATVVGVVGRVPDRRSSGHAGRGFAVLIVLGLAVCFSFTPSANAATVTVGSFDAGNCYPFLCNDSGTSSGQSIEYQQVYASSAFSGPVSITALTFFFASEFGGSSLVLDGSYKVSLSTTSAPINGLSSIAANNIGPDNTVFATFVVSSHNVDSNPSFTITGGPFTYDPSKGNLLIDLVVTNQDNVPNGSGNGYNEADDTGTQTSRLYAFDGNGVGITDSIGLVTEFTYNSGVELQNYFSNAQTTGGQAYVNIIAPLEGNTTGTTAAARDGETCAMIYVFNTEQSLQACCGCPVTADGLLTLNLTTQLAGNPVATGKLLSDGVIRIISTLPNAVPPPATVPPTTPAAYIGCDSNTQVCCDPTAASTGNQLIPESNLVAWADHIQNTQITEKKFEANAPTAAELNDGLPGACAAITRLGSGQGACTCPTGPVGFTPTAKHRR
jgi:hypothetical protein